MQKFRKKFTAIAAILCLTLTLALFAACGNGDGGKEDGNTVTYTVTVKLPDGSNAGADIAVGFCTDSCKNVFTDANGVATFEGEKGVNYHVQISYLSAELRDSYVATGYTSEDQECYVNNWNGNTSHTITLTAAE